MKIFEIIIDIRNNIRRNNIIRVSILSIAVMLLAFSTYKIGSFLWESYETSKNMQDILEVFNENNTTAENPINTSKNDDSESPITSEENAQTENKAVLEKIVPLLKINSDIVGWIKIVGSKVIDYPVLQAVDNEYYLKHNFTKQSKKHGQIFMDYRNNDFELDKNTILYGHNMMDGLMFGELPKYKDWDYAQKCSVIEFGTNYEEYKWEVFAVYVTDIKHDYLKVDFVNDEKFMEYVNDAKKRSINKFNVDVKPGDKILTLSTCTYDFKDARFVVHARLKRAS